MLPSRSRRSAVDDVAGNKNTASAATGNIPIDTIRPRPTITAPTTPQNGAFDVTVDFGEPVTGFVATDMVSSGTPTANILKSGADGSQSYTLTVTPSTTHVVELGLYIRAGKAKDMAGNNNLKSAVVGVDTDLIRPTPTITGAPTTPQNGAFDVTVDFGENVTGFTADDLTATGVRAANILKSGTDGSQRYTITVTPSLVGIVNVSLYIDANVAKDTAGNNNLMSASVSVATDLVPPTVAISDVPTTKQNGPFDLTVTFSEDVTGFAKEDLTVTGEATATAVAAVGTSKKVYTATITSNAAEDGDVTVQVNADAVEDVAGNKNTASAATGNIPIGRDTIRPTPTITAPTTPQNGAFDVTVDFGENVTGFTAGDLTSSGTATANILKSGADGSQRYTITVTPSFSTSLGLYIRANRATDTAGNNNLMSEIIWVDADLTPPTPTITAPTTPQNGAFDVTVDFGENVTGFTAGDLTATGTVLGSNVLKSGTDGSQRYTITVKPSLVRIRNVSLYIDANRAKDTAGNNNLMSEIISVGVDLTPPTVTISDVPTTPQNGPFDLTITFSEDVTGFAKGDLTVTGEATATAVAAVGTSKKEYTATITPNANAEGDVTVQVDADAVEDVAGNKNTASAATGNIPIGWDTIRPTVTISDVPTTPQNGPFDLTITFSEDVTGFAKGDLRVTGEATATAVSGSGSSYTATITPNAAKEGDVTVKVKASAVDDAAGNKNTASSATGNIHIDTIAPTPTITAPTTPQNGDFDVTVDFGENVTGVTARTLSSTGTVLGSNVLKSGTDGSQRYTITVKPTIPSFVHVSLYIDAGQVRDTAGNNNLMSAIVGVGVDLVPPTVAISDVPTTKQNGPFDLTVTFSEDVTGFAKEDLTVTGEATATAVAAVGTSKKEYTATITPNANAEGDVTVTVNANTVQDAALNDNTASTETDSIHVDTIPPTVSVAVTPPTVEANGYETEERNSPYDLTVTFSEEVNGFAAGDVTVTGPGTAALTTGSDGDTVYTVTITPEATSEGDVTVTVNANTVQDSATNQNPAGSAPIAVHIDTIAPTFTIEDTPVLQKINDFFDIRVVFSEPVNGFRPADFTSSDLVTPSLQAGADGASEYTVRMTPNEDVQGNLFIKVNAETAQDLALNLNAAAVATTQPVRIDTLAPTVQFADLPTGTQDYAFDVSIIFSEAVNGFTTGDIALVGPATVRLTAGTDGDAIYTALITPNPGASGNVTLEIPAGVVEDFAENVNLASDLTDPIPVNTMGLTVELEDVPDTVQLDAFSVRIVFSNDVEGFGIEDIEITGDAVVQNSTLLGSGSTYTLIIIPDENTDGDVVITVPAGATLDAAGRSNVASVPQTVAVAPIWMPDASLRAVFRELLGLDEGADFTQQQLRTITTLTFEMAGISDITGVEQATGLTTLVIPENGITDITSLRRLTQLTTLNLAGNAVTDITPLAGLTGLTSLNLSGNRLTSIDALEDLTSLTTLDLSNNALADFTPLASLTALTTLELGGTGLSSLSAISGLTALTSLNLGDNGLTNIARLANLTVLTGLDLNDNAISDITPLASLTALTDLELADNAITNLTPLTTLASLTDLDLTDNSITDVGPLAGLANLETLRLAGNSILNTAPLYPLTQRVPPVDIDIEVSQYPPWDVNEDGIVDAADFALVTAALGQTGDAIVNPRTDVNGDGTVDNADLTLVTANLVDVALDGVAVGGALDGVAGAPATESLLALLDAKTLGTLDRETLETYLHQLRVENDGSLAYRNVIAMLEGLLAVLRPTETRLLANYPNPFNPETWLPYELAADSSVEIFIYDARGGLVRHLKLGHQPAGYYVAKSRAAYWDGRNKHGERVSSGVYFYQLRAGDISQLRKMVILK